MAGLYIHIPFCRKVCFYCDFHFTVSIKNKDEILSAICDELKIWKEEWSQHTFETIYIGGGTPSVLTISEIQTLFKCIWNNYQIEPAAEITFETNPDDLTSEYLAALQKDTPINRLSIGIQSFREEDLKLMNRRHTSKDAVECIKRSQEDGFQNLNIDLIYGIPGMSVSDWNKNLTMAFQLKVPHLSCYHLTFEPKTVFYKYLKMGRLKPAPEHASQEQFKSLVELTAENGFEHYEISNFAKEKQYSTHNSNYWLGKPYLGIGPSAHSYLGNIRRWNRSNNSNYLKQIRSGEQFYDEESLDTITLYNEYMLTSLRTMWGSNLKKITSQFGERLREYAIGIAKKYSQSKDIIFTEDIIRLTEKGKLRSDHIIADFFWVK